MLPRLARRFSKIVPFRFDPNVWYRMKFRVEPTKENGPTKVMAKVWKRDEPEPAKWLIEKVDKIPHRAGAPGLYGDGISDVFFDNLKVYKNQ